MSTFVEIKYSCMDKTSTTLLQRVEIFARGSENIPPPKSTWVTGSIAYDMSTGTFYMLDNEAGVWVNQEDFTEFEPETVSTTANLNQMSLGQNLNFNQNLFSETIAEISESEPKEIEVQNETLGHDESE